MPLLEEIQKTKKEIVTDGYEMSFGEIINLYKDGELFINPEFQRLFRWSPSQKTRFIESLLLGIPIPPIFVFQSDSGVWELVDGLQRVSTILEFMGELKNNDKQLVPPSILEGTNFLPSLANKKWAASLDEEGREEEDGIGKELQIEIKRSRMRVEILKKQSDKFAKYELFQRLNTGGSNLSEQEVRNCIAVMIDESFYQWMKNCAINPNFLATISQTDDAIEKQMGMELVLRYLAFRNIPYQRNLDVHEYLDKALVDMARDKDFNRTAEAEIFSKTFDYLNTALGSSSFKRWDGNRFTGMFLQSLFEVIATGISNNIAAIEAMAPEERSAYIVRRIQALWADSTFTRNSGAGIRGTTRLANLLPLAQTYFNGEN